MAIGARYEALIRQGMSDDVFHAYMNAMVSELGDEHSHFQSPKQIQQEQAEIAGQQSFVGIGALNTSTPEDDRAIIIDVFPNSPAAEAGLRPHDAVIQVDGGPVFDQNHMFRTLGPEGSEVTITVLRPGEPPRDMRLTRRKVTGPVPLNSCIIPQTRIGYIFLANLLDETLPDRIRETLRKMTTDGKLDGLILDNRLNSGGAEKVARSILGLFTNGVQGKFVESREQQGIQYGPRGHRRVAERATGRTCRREDRLVRRDRQRAAACGRTREDRWTNIERQRRAAALVQFRGRLARVDRERDFRAAGSARRHLGRYGHYSGCERANALGFVYRGN